MMVFGCAVAVVFCVGLLFFYRIHDTLAVFQEDNDDAFAEMLHQLRHRHELAKDIARHAGPFMIHDCEVIDTVNAASGRASDASGQVAADIYNTNAMYGLIAAERALSADLTLFMAAADGYPALAADDTMAGLVAQFSGAQDRISFMQQAYNGAVMTYNIRCERLPSALVATLMRFRRAVLVDLEIDHDEDESATSPDPGATRFSHS